MKLLTTLTFIIVAASVFAQSDLQTRIAKELHLTKTQIKKLHKILNEDKGQDRQLADTMAEDEFKQELKELDTKHLDPDLNIDFVMSLKLTAKQKSKFMNVVKNHLQNLTEAREDYFKNIRGFLNQKQKDIFDDFYSRD